MAYCCHFGKSNTPPPPPRHPPSTPCSSFPLRSIPKKKKKKKRKSPEGRSPLQPTLPSKKPREGVVPPGTGKPFILGSSLLTDSCVDWKVGCALYGPGLSQPCGLSVPDPPPPQPPSTSPLPFHQGPHHKSICTNGSPLKSGPDHPLYFCPGPGPCSRLHHPAFKNPERRRVAIVSRRPSAGGFGSRCSRRQSRDARLALGREKTPKGSQMK